MSRRVSITELVDAETPTLTGALFADVDIVGPAMVYLDSCTLQGCSLPPQDAGAYVVVPADQRRITGAVALLRCTFVNCRFLGVGFIGPQRLIDEILVACMGIG